MRSSIGYHTAMVFMKITKTEAMSIYEDFVRYGNKTGEIRTRPIHTTTIDSDADKFIKQLYSGLSKIHRMEYTCKDKGLRWDMRRSISSPGYIKSNFVGEDTPCTIKAKINPKVLNGEFDYLTAATSDCLRDVEKAFNIEAAKISPLLRKFDAYAYNRIDYCFNGDTNELRIGCTVEQMMKLMKRGNIPDGFHERTKYDANSHREKSCKDSFYLKSNSVVINCYCKGKQLEKQHSDNICIDNSHNLIRFEVQCKYSKVYAMSSVIKEENNGSNAMMMKALISNKVCEDVIRKYFSKIVRKGHYFTLSIARKIVKAHNFRRDKEERLIYALELINECRGIAKAKSKLLGIDLQEFKRSLKDLDDILVNPVTVPRDWKIDYIPNLLWAYYDSIYDEQLITLQEFEANKCLSEYSIKNYSA